MSFLCPIIGEDSIFPIATKTIPAIQTVTERTLINLSFSPKKMMDKINSHITELLYNAMLIETGIMSNEMYHNQLPKKFNKVNGIAYKMYLFLYFFFLYYFFFFLFSFFFFLFSYFYYYLFFIFLFFIFFSFFLFFFFFFLFSFLFFIFLIFIFFKMF